MSNFERVGNGRKPVGNKTYALGTNVTVSFTKNPRGFLTTVFTAYAHHLHLVTSPEDWWLTLYRRWWVQWTETRKRKLLGTSLWDMRAKRSLLYILTVLMILVRRSFSIRCPSRLRGTSRTLAMWLTCSRTSALPPPCMGLS